MNLPLSEGAEEYLSWLAVEKGRSRNTLLAYRRDIATWEAWAEQAGVDPVGASTDAVERHLADLRSQGRTPASMARSTTALRGLYRFLVSEGVLRADPTVDVRSPRLPRRLSVCPTSHTRPALGWPMRRTGPYLPWSARIGS